MSDWTIPDDATITDVIRRNRLNKPIEYVRRVLGNMAGCKKEHGNASVRIGTRGEGRAPNYLIEYSREGRQRSDRFGAFNGLGHNKMENLYVGRRVVLDSTDDRNLREDHWSSQIMTYDAVASLLQQMRSRRH